MKLWFVRFFTILTLLLAALPALAQQNNATLYCHAKLENGLERCVPADETGACPADSDTTHWDAPNQISCKCGTNTPYSGDECTQLQNPLKNEDTNPAAIVGTIIKTALGVSGAVALLMFFLGAFRWVAAAGNEEKIKAGTQTMIWSALGLAVVFGSYVVVNIVINFITGQGTSGPQ